MQSPGSCCMQEAEPPAIVRAFRTNRDLSLIGNVALELVIAGIVRFVLPMPVLQRSIIRIVLIVPNTRGITIISKTWKDIREEGVSSRAVCRRCASTWVVVAARHIEHEKASHLAFDSCVY